MTLFELIIIEVILLFLLVGSLIKYYKSSNVTFDVILITFISWSLGFASIILLPYDMAINLSNKQNNNNILFPLWEAIYWRYFISFYSFV